MGLCAHMGFSRDRIETILLPLLDKVPAELMLELGRDVIGEEGLLAEPLIRSAMLPPGRGILPIQRISRPLVGLHRCSVLFSHVLVGVLVVVGDGADRCQRVLGGLTSLT